LPEIGLVKDEVAFDIGIGLKKSNPKTIQAVKTAIKEIYPEKNVVIS
jgi:hypothetical protein